MLIVPLEKPIDWNRPPVVTLLLILLNGVVFFSTQADDYAAFRRAVKFYVKSDLPDIEFPRYVSDLKARGEADKADRWEKSAADSAEADVRIRLLMEMERDGDFMRRLRAYAVITRAHPRFGEWSLTRGRYESLLRESAIYSFGFVPAEHRPLTLVTHVFVHGGMGHLLGNMLFLFLLGFAIEVALGSLAYALLYLTAGLGAASLFWAVNPDSYIPLVGASGAIAGLMGMYAILFGLRKIRFFYSVLFYFDYVRAPAIVMFPLWLTNEFYQLTWGEISNVAYVAHIGGLVAGAVIALGIKRLPGRVDVDYLNASAREEERTRRVEEGMQLLGSLQIDKAKRALRSLHRDYPEDRTILMQLYRAEKFDPDSDQYHRIAQRVLVLPGDDSESAREVHEAFQDYLRTTGGKLRIDAGTLVDTANRFVRAGHLETAEKVLVSLVRSKREAPGLDRALLALAKGWQRVRNPRKSRRYLDMLLHHFPHSEAAAGVRQALTKGGTQTL